MPVHLSVFFLKRVINGSNECKTQRFEFDWYSFVYLNLELTSAVAKKCGLR